MTPTETAEETHPLRRAREEAGLTQLAFAEMLGVTRPSIANWESGKVTPTGPARMLIALKLGLSVKDVEAWWNPENGDQ